MLVCSHTPKRDAHRAPEPARAGGGNAGFRRSVGNRHPRTPGEGSGLRPLVSFGMCDRHSTNVPFTRRGRCRRLIPIPEKPGWHASPPPKSAARPPSSRRERKERGVKPTRILSIVTAVAVVLLTAF